MAAKSRARKVVRDSFTMPAADYSTIGVLKNRCLALGVAVKKSELLRAGLRLLHRLQDGELGVAVSAVENVKTGRPRKDVKADKAGRAKGKRK